jgi:tetratricopeptide (TPR) repeat protein
MGASVSVSMAVSSGSGISVSEKKDFPFPKIGVRLCVFEEAIKGCGGREAMRGMNTTDVCSKFLMPATSQHQISFCEMLQQSGSPNVGKANVFISHAWRYGFLDVVDALQHHFKHEPDTYIWFDLFSNNQHLAGNLPFEWWTETFMSAIKEIGRVVMVLSPWNNPIPFTRAWCLFEVYSTIITKSKFEVAMCENERNSFLQQMRDDIGVFTAMLAEIDVKKSDAWNKDDLKRIFEVVENKLGFQEVNMMVKGKMRGWVDATLKETVDRMASESLTVEVILQKMSYAHNLKDTGRSREAMQVYQECLDAFVLVEGERSINVATAYNSLAGCHLKKDSDNSTALEFFAKALAIFTQAEGDNRSGVATTYNNIALVYDKQADYTKALEYYDKALAIHTEVGGENHVHIAKSHNNMAVVYHNMGVYDKALVYHEKALQLRLSALGANHPDVATTYNNLAGVYQTEANYSKALECFEKALGIYLEAFGTNHPLVATIHNNVAVVYTKQGEFAKSLKYFYAALDIYIQSFGANHPDVAVILNSIALAHSKLGDASKAIETFEKELAIWQLLLTEDEDNMTYRNHEASVYNNIASILLKEGGQEVKALDFFDKALAIKKQVLGENHFDVATIFSHMATIAVKQDEYPKALEFFEKALPILSAKLGENHTNTKVILANIEQLRQIVNP